MSDAMDAESVTKTEGGSETTPKDKKDKRTSRACLTCRTRKSACHLPEREDDTSLVQFHGSKC
ncbi:hypothetical protein LTR75_015138 [Friedmanniomyces endolithicus]|nr:hypothetical protein LTR75_015138 [Friedmanniomyces endolithicus]